MIHPAIYFHGATGNRIVVDLQIPYASGKYTSTIVPAYADSCWIYTGN